MSSLAVPASSTRAHLFTTANAKEMSARGNAAKVLAKQRREELIATANAIPILPPDEDFRIRRLVRVRKQLAKLDDMIEAESEPQKLDRLASAQARLAKQEQELAGRPLPGSRRPGKEKPARTVANSGPIED